MENLSLSSEIKRCKQVKVLGEDVSLLGLDLHNDHSVMAICRRKKKKAKIALTSIEFPDMTKEQLLWIKAWKEWSHES